MANPQLEDGFTMVANEIFEALAGIRIPGQAWQTLCVIIRKTYGFKKKTDHISLSQFKKLTGIAQPNIVRALKVLIRMNLVIKKDNENGASYRFNKDYDTWKPLSKQISVIKNDNLALSEQIHTKETIQKKERNIVGSKKPTNPDIKIFTDWWCREFQKQFGVKYHYAGGKDAKLIQGMLRSHSIGKLKIYTKLFWTSGDEFSLGGGFTIGVFNSKINAIALKEKGIDGKPQKLSWRQRQDQG